VSLLDAPRQRARLVIAGLGVCILVAAWRFIPGLLGACALFVMSGALYDRLLRRMRPRLAAAAVIAIIVLLIMVPLVTVATLMAGRAPGIVEQIIEGSTFDRLSAVQLGRIHVGAILDNIGMEVREALPGEALRLLGGLVQVTINLFIALFGLYYLLLAGDATWKRVKDFLPLSASNAELLRVRFRSVTEAMILGIAATAIVQGSIVGLGFWVVGLDDPLFWGGITAIVSVLPVFGSALVWLPGIVVLLINGRPEAAIVLGILGGGIASNIDNLIRPIVYWKVSDLHPLTTIVGAFAGLAVFGLSGLIIGPLILSYFFEMLRVYRAEFGPETPAEPGVA
jgi:predicted PurR-regulated permease PerM